MCAKIWTGPKAVPAAARMMTEHSRLTLVVAGQREDEWVLSDPGRLLIVESMAALRFLIRARIFAVTLDVERLILDGGVAAIECLDLLASLPHEFGGDVLMVVDERNAYLSSTGRGGDRILYSLVPADVEFYLSAHGVQRTTEPPLSVLTASRRLSA